MAVPAARFAATRATLLDRLTGHVLSHGLEGASLRPLARAAGTSDRMLLYYFRDKSELIGAILQAVAERLQAELGAAGDGAPLPPAALVRELVALATSAALWPYMRIWLEVAARAAHGDPLFRTIGEAIGRGFLAWGAVRLDSPEATRETDAARVLLMVEGALFLHSIGLGDVARRAIED